VGEQDVLAAVVQGPAESGELVEAGGDPCAERVGDAVIAALPAVLSRHEAVGGEAGLSPAVLADPDHLRPVELD